MKKLAKEFKSTPPKELWVEGVTYNFVYGFLGSTIVVAITLGMI